MAVALSSNLKKPLVSGFFREKNSRDKRFLYGGIGERDTRVGEEEFCEGTGGIGVREIGQGITHDRAQERIGVDLTNGLSELVGGGGALVETKGATALDKRFSVAALMVISRRRQRNENSRHGTTGKLKASGGAGTGNDKVGLTIGGAHVLHVRNDLDLRRSPGITRANGLQIGLTALVHNAHMAIAQSKGGKHGGNKLVHAARTLTAPRDKDGEEPLGTPGLAGSLQGGEDALPKGKPRMNGVRPRQLFGRLWETCGDGRNGKVFGKESRGLPGEAVGLVQHHGNTKTARGKHRGHTGVTTRGEKKVGGLPTEKRTATEKGKKVTGIFDGARSGLEEGPLPVTLGGTLGGTGAGEDE